MRPHKYEVLTEYTSTVFLILFLSETTCVYRSKRLLVVVGRATPCKLCHPGGSLWAESSTWFGMATVSIAWRRDLGSGASTVASNNLTTSIDCCICAANSCFSLHRRIAASSRLVRRLRTKRTIILPRTHALPVFLSLKNLNTGEHRQPDILLFEVPEDRSGLAQWPGRTRDAASMIDAFRKISCLGYL